MKKSMLAISLLFSGLVLTPQIASAGTYNLCESLLNPTDGFYFSTDVNAPTPNASDVEFQYINIVKGDVRLAISLGGYYNGTDGWGSKCQPVKDTKIRSQLSLDQSAYNLFEATLDCKDIDIGGGKKENMIVTLDIHAESPSSVQVKSPSLDWNMDLKPSGQK